jgi:diguanylate cyclase (GGDEF)-like protein
MRLLGGLGLLAPAVLAGLYLAAPAVLTSWVDEGSQSVLAAVAAGTIGVSTAAIVSLALVWLRFRSLIRATERIAAGEPDVAVRVPGGGLERRLAIAVNGVSAAVSASQHAASVDKLTGVANRQALLPALFNEVERASRYHRALSVAFVDIDHFKAVNDTYGHDVGDAVLRDTAQTIRAATRATDEVCRIGGEEFLIICKHTTESDCSVAVERIRSAVESHIVEEPSFMTNVTVSMGYAAFTDGMTSFNDLLKAADEAVYVAKANGRNRAVSYTELQDLRHSA